MGGSGAAAADKSEEPGSRGKSAPSAVGDFNGDGKSDLAVANANSSNVSVLLGTGTGSFGPATNFSVGSSPRSVAVGDFNGDGKSDLAVARVVTDEVVVKMLVDVLVARWAK